MLQLKCSESFLMDFLAPIPAHVQVTPSMAARTILFKMHPLLGNCQCLPVSELNQGSYNIGRSPTIALSSPCMIPITTTFSLGVHPLQFSPLPTRQPHWAPCHASYTPGPFSLRPLTSAAPAPRTVFAQLPAWFDFPASEICCSKLIFSLKSSLIPCNTSPHSPFLYSSTYKFIPKIE